jgi:hypothetical protein
MSLNTFFDKVFCINLDSRPDRWQTCLEIFDKHHIEAERFPAIYMKNNCTEACTWSHVALYKMIAAGPWNKVLILEDDFHILTLADIIAGGFKPDDAVSKTFMSVSQKGFVERFDYLVEFLPTDWDLVYLGAGYGGPPISRANKHVIRCGDMMTTSSYGITRDCAKAIFTAVNGKDPYGPPDSLLSTFSRQFKFYVFQPRLMIQRPGKSDLTGRVDSYLFSMCDPVHESML